MILYLAPGERGGVPVLPPGYDDGSWSGGGVTGAPPPRSPGDLLPSPTPAPRGPDLSPEEAARAYRQAGGTGPRSRSFCAGLETAICGEAGAGPRLFGNFGGPYTNDLCRSAASVACLTLGVLALIALLALGLNALVRG